MPRRFFIAFATALAACAPPTSVKPYRIDIQQGNYITQEMVSQLRQGMSKEQVRYILGTPLVTDIFHGERWDYVYYHVPAYQRAEQRRLSVFFEDDRLVKIGGDVVPADPAKAAAQEPKPAPKPEPKAEEKKAEEKKDAKKDDNKDDKGFFSRLRDKLGMDSKDGK
jgi:outer membrane protein assembly factor BamE